MSDQNKKSKTILTIVCTNKLEESMYRAGDQKCEKLKPKGREKKYFQFFLSLLTV
mgnify:FL=1